MMWVWVIVGGLIALMCCLASLTQYQPSQYQPRKQTKTTITMNGHRSIVIVDGRQVEDELDELEEWDLQDHLEELEEE